MEKTGLNDQCAENAGNHFPANLSYEVPPVRDVGGNSGF